MILFFDISFRHIKTKTLQRIEEFCLLELYFIIKSQQIAPQQLRETITKSDIN